MVYDQFSDSVSSLSELQLRLAHLQPAEILFPQSCSAILEDALLNWKKYGLVDQVDISLLDNLHFTGGNQECVRKNFQMNGLNILQLFPQSPSSTVLKRTLQPTPLATAVVAMIIWTHSLQIRVRETQSAALNINLKVRLTTDCE